jgi:ribonuclease VapC
LATSVLDASALLAYLRNEPGAEAVLATILGDTTMTTLNFSEVAQKLVVGGAGESELRDLRSRLVFPLVDIDDDLAIRAALLVPHTRAHGLSLADRICLALAGRLGVSAVTADRAWEALAAIIGIRVELIR